MPGSFGERCEALFAPLHGQRWKTTSASALRISRATFCRYLDGSTDVPSAVLDALEELEGSTRPVLDDRGMVVLAASALVAIQRQVDDVGYLKTPYPRAVQRTFDVGAARNLEEGEGRWPIDLRSLAELASCPLGLWAGDMAWDREDLFAECLLVENGGLPRPAVIWPQTVRTPSKNSWSATDSTRYGQPARRCRTETPSTRPGAGASSSVRSSQLCSRRPVRSPGWWT